MNLRTRIKNLNELQRNTVMSAVGLGAMILILFVCIFRVSNATALVILGSAAILSFVSLLTASTWRYVLLPFSSACWPQSWS